MMEPVETHVFVGRVRQALAALYDYPRLQASPLAPLLVGDLPVSARGPALHRALAAAIERLRPVGADIGSVAARRYQYLYLRYVDVRDIATVAATLGVSLRQARRDHHDAVNVLASSLYEACRARRPSGTGDVPPAAPHAPSAPDGALEPFEPVEPRGPADLHEVITSALDTLRPLARARGVTLRLAPAAASSVVAIERAVARQIVIGAAGHAIASVREGTITLRTATSQHVATLAIRFVPNRPLDEGSEDQRLTMCRRLLALVHGGLTAAARAGETELVLTLPTAASATILVVDDNADARRLLRRHLAAGAYHVVEASGYAEALALARTAAPRAVLLDIMLPGHDGWELLQRLKQRPGPAGLPVIVCSALGDRELALALGAADVLEKPVTQERLLAAVARLLRPEPAQRHRGRAGDNASLRER